jgi:hypothetical protein
MLATFVPLKVLAMFKIRLQTLCQAKVWPSLIGADFRRSYSAAEARRRQSARVLSRLGGNPGLINSYQFINLNEFGKEQRLLFAGYLHNYCHKR